MLLCLCGGGLGGVAENQWLCQRIFVRRRSSVIPEAVKKTFSHPFAELQERLIQAAENPGSTVEVRGTANT